MFMLVAKPLWCYNTFSMGKNKWSIKKQSILSKLKDNYKDHQAHSLMIAIQLTNLIFNLSIISTTIVPFVQSNF